MRGVYQIVSKVNGKKYIGSSNNINNRMITHRSNLNNQKHHSSKLQKDWNEYGADNFTFEILEDCEGLSLEEVAEKEQEYINKYNTFKDGYNSVEKVNPIFVKEENPNYLKGKNVFFVEKKVSRFGNSKGVNIPVEFLVSLGVKQGDSVFLTFEDGKIIIDKYPPIESNADIFKKQVVSIIEEYLKDKYIE